MQINIALIGYGTVGEALFQQVSAIKDVNIKRVLVKDVKKQRNLKQEFLCYSVNDVLKDPSIAIVLEAIDDEQAAFYYAKQTLKAGKVYVSASKKMIANNLQELRKFEVLYGGQLYYEAAVCGAIPVLRVLKEHLTLEPVERIRGIVNGSCNYILEEMYRNDLEFDVALKQAQVLGYAESNPSLDIDGWDSYYKSIILSEAAFRRYPDLENITWQGIRNVTLHEVQKEKKKGKKIKLIVDIQKQQNRVKIKIAPAVVRADDPLFNVDGVMNAVIIYSAYAQQLSLVGPGAGGDPTASAMVGDLQRALKSLNAADQTLLMSMH